MILFLILHGLDLGESVTDLNGNNNIKTEFEVRVGLSIICDRYPIGFYSFFLRIWQESLG